MHKVGLVLSGCGVYDGSELHESIITMLELDKAGVEVICIAPDVVQADVINHLDGSPSAQSRSVLLESARIARGEVKVIANMSVDDFDALIFPGGFGAAKNLSNYASSAADCSVEPSVHALIEAMHRAGKPIAALCIAPVLLAKVLGGGVNLTIGNDSKTAADIAAMGAKHSECSVQDIVIDSENKVVTTPAYMLATSIADLHIGIAKVVKQLIQMIE
jgi:enhancing lycopene biosynthesis protein 2